MRKNAAMDDDGGEDEIEMICHAARKQHVSSRKVDSVDPASSKPTEAQAITDVSVFDDGTARMLLSDTIRQIFVPPLVPSDMMQRGCAAATWLSTSPVLSHIGTGTRQQTQRHINKATLLQSVTTTLWRKE